MVVETEVVEVVEVAEVVEGVEVLRAEREVINVCVNDSTAEDGRYCRSDARGNGTA